MELGGISVKTIFSAIMVIVIGLALLPIVIDSVAAAAASLTGAAQTMVNLIPLFYVLALIIAVVVWATASMKGR
jgi:hypothetical protein